MFKTTIPQHQRRLISHVSLQTAVQGALQWLEDNQDKSLEEIQAAQADDDEDEDETKAKIAELETGQSAKSLICNECGKRFRNPDLASYHASKTYGRLLCF